MIVLQNGNAEDSLLNIREGARQGEPLAIVTYGIHTLPMIKQLKAIYPDSTQPWYADNAGGLGMYDNIELYFNFIKQSIPGSGY